jgi:hypothetical protein
LILAFEGVNRSDSVKAGVVLYLYIEVIEAVKSHVIGPVCPVAEMNAALPGNAGFCIQIEILEQVDLHNKHLVVARKKCVEKSYTCRLHCRQQDTNSGRI